MRGTDERTGASFSYVDLDARVRKDHPLRTIRAVVNEALGTMEREIAPLYSGTGRPSIAPERLLRAMLLQAFYSIRSERQLLELTLPLIAPVHNQSPFWLLVLSGPGCKLVRGETAEARVRSAAVVVGPPSIDDPAGLRQAPEQVLVEALVAEASVQALDEAVLLGLAGGDVVPLDSAFLLPAQDGMGGQLGAVVADDHLRPDHAIRRCGRARGRHAVPGERGVDDERQALPGEVVDHDEHPEPSTVRQRVRDEVEAPALVRSLRQASWAPACRALAYGRRAASRSASPPGRDGRASCD